MKNTTKHQNLTHQNTKKNGFTLVELLIVVTLSVMLLLGASAMFMTFLLSNSRLNSEQIIENEGTFALQQMTFLIRNAVEIVPNSSDITCQQDMTELRLKSIDGGTTTLTSEIDSSDDSLKIASGSGVYLTSNAVDLVEGPIFDCTEQSDGQQQFVNVSFTLRKGTPNVDLERDVLEQEFQEGVVIRSF